MKRKLISLALAAAMCLGLFTGCEKVGQIAGSVAEAAMNELKTQVEAVLEEYQVDPIEITATAGKLNDGEGQLQIFCAILVRSDNEALPRSCAEALGKLFADAGIMVQNGREISSSYLVHKSLRYDRTDFSGEGTYYTIYVYSTIDPSGLLDSVKSE